MNESSSDLAPDRNPAGNDLRDRLLTGSPAVERRLELAGVSTAVLEGGDGAPMVLLHNLGEFAALWTGVTPELMRTHRVVAPDLPGHGATGVPDGPLDVDRTLTWLGALIEETCPSPPVLVGRGLGGAIAARFVIDQGDRVERLVLVGSLGLAPFEPAPSFGLAMQEFLAQPTEKTRDALFAQCFVDLDRLRERMGPRWEPIAAYALERARIPKLQAAQDELMHHFGVPAIPEADLARIEVPTALIWGRGDLLVRLAVGESARSRYGWPLHTIDGAGDDPPMEQPAAFLAALQDAIRS